MRQALSLLQRVKPILQFANRQTMLLATVCVSVLLASVPESSIAADRQTSESQEIINGLPVSASAQPWMVALVRNTSRTDLPLRKLQYCGGTLIAAEWVLTAAHCVLARSVSDTSVIIGASDLDAPGVKKTAIDQIVIHPHYNARSVQNDIALLRLAAPSPLTPLSLFSGTSDAELEGMTATAYGWGLTYIANPNCEPIFANSELNPANYDCRIYDLNPGSRPSQGTLLHTELRLLSDAACAARIQELIDFLEGTTSQSASDDATGVKSQICAYDPVAQRGVCFGDSGGPLIVEQGGKRYHAGIASLIYGTGGCARQLATDVFTKTAVFREFIDDVMHRDYSLSFENYCPPQITPTVEYMPQSNGNSLVRISWQAYAQATRYTLRYASYPLPEQVQALYLQSPITELSAELAPGTSFYVTLQATNAQCSGPGSPLVAVQVPVL